MPGAGCGRLLKHHCGLDRGQPIQAEKVKPTDETTDKRRREAAIALVQSWRDEENEEARDQCETWKFLEAALNDNRLSKRKRV